MSDRRVAAAAGATLRSRGDGRPEERHPPVPEQRKAIEDRGRDLFLAAGAGTGKTSVLVERFCDVVSQADGDDAAAGVENVLAFTFTERAAGELKRRIREELIRRARSEGDPGRGRRLRTLARDSEAAWISTIHSFCRRVLASHPLAAGVDPGFRVLDESAAARVSAEAFDAAFERFCAGGDAERFELAAAYRLPALRAIVRSAHGELRARGQERPALPALESPDVGAAVAGLHAAAKEALSAAGEVKRTAKAEECLALIADAVAGTDRRMPTEEEVERWSFNSKPLETAAVERYHEARATLERRLVEARFAHRYEHLRELMRVYAEEYARLKDERSALDFEDLELRARELLRRRPEARQRYQRQFRHLMVDEFQDTNALQLEIVELLHLEDGVPCNRLFTVGDELQSIYAFRHADVDVFRTGRVNAERAPDAEAGVRRLAGNFRSHPDVLGLVNRVGRELFGAAHSSLAAGRLPGRPGVEPAAEVLVAEKNGWDEDDAALEISADERAQPWRVAEARFLAGRLLELHRSGTARDDIVVLLRSFSFVDAYEQALADAGLAPYVVGGRGYWSKQQVTDVRNLLACVANPLDDKALLGALASPACGVAPDTLWLLRQAAGAAPVWSALRWIYGSEGGDRSAASLPEDPARAVVQGEWTPEALGEWRANAVTQDESTPEALAAWRGRAQELSDHVPEADAAALEEFVAVLLELRDEAPRLSLEALIDRTITATGYDLALLMRSRGRRRLANVRKLMRLAREFEAEEGRDLRGFLDFTAHEAESDAREAEAAVDAEGHDGVRLMTVHAAKGLEFPVVAVADLGRRLSAGAPPTLRLEPRVQDGEGRRTGDAEAMRVGLRLARLGRRQMPIFDYAELEQRAVEREREEERRILHVAMTRAQRHLILSGVLELEKLWDEPKHGEPLIAPVLRALEWSDGRSPVELEPPPLRPGLDGELAPARVAIRVRRPRDEDAARVGAAEPPARADGADRPSRAEGAEPPARSAGAEPPARVDGAERAVPVRDRPLQDPDLTPLPSPPEAPVRSLSYSALSLYERCGYRFYAERVLGLQPRPPAGPAGPAAGDERHPAGRADGLTSRYGQGRVVHELLEHSARHGWREPGAGLVADLLRREGLEAGHQEVDRIVRLVRGFLEAPIRGVLAAAGRVHPEAPFAFRAGDLVVRGEIDLLADLGDQVVVVDYKSDALGDAAPAEHMGRYEVQRRIYALAALRRYGRPVRVCYVFLERPDDPVEVSFAPEDASRLSREITAMTAAIADGRFEVTSSPERSLCFDCPARARLCVHGPDLTLRDPWPR